MIKTVIRSRNDIVMVFDESGEPLPEFQGYYPEVKTRILAAAPEGAVFNHWFGHAPEPQAVGSKTW